ncbi:unnamed protein product [Periconia digitata]|uniref:Major facilitator superfamily (MFS) profile domain-containing protein n=1 Tax=Periconia digitata TaxID=1303443 RepID=A0A9W4U954_9PLEO|nr:unnamed protein product [Periconia digitata]
MMTLLQKPKTSLRPKELSSPSSINHPALLSIPNNEHDLQISTKRLLWKLDTRILPLFTLLTLCSFLDRTNVGNAKLFHLEFDLHMTNSQYNKGLTAFYPLYIVGAVPSNLVLKKITPRIWIGFMAFVWGLLCMCIGFIHPFPQFVGLRAVLGLAEGGLFPGMVLYLSTMYTREQLALRIGALYTATSLSSAFGGLLARAMAEIGNRGGLSAWRWIFVIEGLFTMSVGVAVFAFLPNSIEDAKFLTKPEREAARQQLQRSKNNAGDQEAEETFTYSEVLRAIFSPQTWLSASAYFGLLTAIYSFGLFLPTILAGIGYTANAAQLWSAIPYSVAACTTMAIAVLSDHIDLRGTLMLCTLPLAITGYAVIANIGDHHARVKHYKRATAAGIQLAVANCGGILASFIYPDREGPGYWRGHTIVLGLLSASWVLVLANVLYCAKINRDKARGRYDKYAGCGDDREPGFRMVL